MQPRAPASAELCSLKFDPTAELGLQAYVHVHFEVAQVRSEQASCGGGLNALRDGGQRRKAADALEIVQENRVLSLARLGQLTGVKFGPVWLGANPQAYCLSRCPPNAASTVALHSTTYTLPCLVVVQLYSRCRRAHPSLTAGVAPVRVAPCRGRIYRPVAFPAVTPTSTLPLFAFPASGPTYRKVFI